MTSQAKKNSAIVACYPVPNSRATLTYLEDCTGETVTRETIQAVVIWDEKSFHPRSKFKVNHFWLTLPRRIGCGRLLSIVRASVESIEAQV